MQHIQLTHEPLDPDLLVRTVRTSASGAIVVFYGIVRDHNLGKAVRYLEYEAYSEMAEQELRAIAAAIQGEFGLDDIAIAHRLGRLEIGEASLLVAASSPHRADAFEACHAAVDRIKHTVPIWKKEFWEDGSHWVEGASAPGIVAPTPSAPA